MIPYRNEMFKILTTLDLPPSWISQVKNWIPIATSTRFAIKFFLFASHVIFFLVFPYQGHSIIFLLWKWRKPLLIVMKLDCKIYVLPFQLLVALGGKERAQTNSTSLCTNSWNVKSKLWNFTFERKLLKTYPTPTP